MQTDFQWVIIENQLKHWVYILQNQIKVFKKKKVKQQNGSTIERSLLVHGQINFIKFVELNNYDVYCKIWNVFVWSNFLKIWRVLNSLN